MALLVFLITAAGLIVLLWVGTLFFQGYIYTEPTHEIYWQAPAAGAALALFLTLWFVLIANSDEANPTNIPYDTLFRFSPTVDKYKEPAREIWVERKGISKPTQDDLENAWQTYLKEREAHAEPAWQKYRTLMESVGIRRFVIKKEAKAAPTYREPNGTGWPAAGVERITIKSKDEASRYVPRPSSGEYQEFVDGEGWVLRVYSDGPLGVPLKFRWGRFFGNMMLNLLHLGLWFAVLWLLLRFQWAHALGFAIVAWLVMTLAILPMILEQAAAQAQKSLTS